MSREVTARHAQIVPSCFVSYVSRPLQHSSGTVLVHELLAWERLGDLSEASRNELRNAIVRRSRSRGEEVWGTRLGVRFDSGWNRWLAPFEEKAVRALTIPEDRPLADWTLGELKRAMHMPLEALLRLLARMEAGYWVAVPGLAQQRADEAAKRSEDLAPLKVTQAIKELGTRALALTWLDSVRPNDLRFAHAAPGKPSAWLATQLEQIEVPRQFVDWMERLLQAETMSAEDEAKDVIRCAGASVVPPRTIGDARERWLAAPILRYVCPEGDGRTLAAVGEALGVTRERVRQQCERFEEFLASASIATPSVDRVIRIATRNAPAEVRDLDTQLRPYLGPCFGIAALLEWARLLGEKSIPIKRERVRMHVRGEPVEVAMIQAAEAQTWVHSALRYVARDSWAFGCTNVLRVAGHLAITDGLAPGQDALVSALVASNGFRWLDEDAGWFSLGDTSNCGAAKRIRKILAVAETSVGTDEITAALASDDLWLYREGPGVSTATPPVHVLRELIKGWPGFKLVQKGRFVPAEGYDFSGELGETERACLEIIGAFDGIACRFELKDEVVYRRGMTDTLLAAQLGSSPVFVKVEFGLYAARGRRIGDSALANARQRLRARAMPDALDTGALNANEFRVRVTEAALKNEQYHVPTRIAVGLQAGTYPVVGEDGVALGEAKVNQSGALTGINKLFPSISVSDILLVAVLGNGLRVFLEQAHSNPEALLPSRR